MEKITIPTLLMVAMMALAGPALATSENQATFSALEGIRAEALSSREMASITGRWWEVSTWLVWRGGW
jgi:hypothetical protein